MENDKNNSLASKLLKIVKEQAEQIKKEIKPDDKENPERVTQRLLKNIKTVNK